MPGATIGHEASERIEPPAFWPELYVDSFKFSKVRDMPFSSSTVQLSSS